MKNPIILIIICFIFYGCTSKGIESFDTEIIQYKDLPNKVKEVMFETEYIELNKILRFEHVSKQDRILPWVYNSEIHRKSDGKKIKLNFSTEHRSRYIIHENYMYVPKHYNIYKADSLKYSFSRFYLEQN